MDPKSPTELEPPGHREAILNALQVVAHEPYARAVELLLEAGGAEAAVRELREPGNSASVKARESLACDS